MNFIHIFWNLIYEIFHVGFIAEDKTDKLGVELFLIQAELTKSRVYMLECEFVLLNASNLNK